MAQNTKFGTGGLRTVNAYHHFMQRFPASGTSLPTAIEWPPGALFHLVGSTTQYNGLYQNKKINKEDANVWQIQIMDENAMAASMIIFNSGPDENGEMAL